MEEGGNRTRFLTDGWSILAEVDQENQIKKRLIRGYGIVASEEEGYHTYHMNEHGDVELILDEEGELCNQYQYDAFGNITKRKELTENRYTYSGEAYDAETMQYYLRARYYHPQIARFTQEDRYRGDGLNLYAYCKNCATMYTDPSGCGAKKADPCGKEESETIQKIRESMAENGLSEEEFLTLMRKSSSKLTIEEAIIMERIRKTVPMPDRNTPLQKVLNSNYVSGYFDGGYLNANEGKIGGCVTTVEDAAVMKNPNMIYYGLRMDYTGSPFTPDDDFVTAIIRRIRFCI